MSDLQKYTVKIRCPRCPNIIVLGLDELQFHDEGQVQTKRRCHALISLSDSYLGVSVNEVPAGKDAQVAVKNEVVGVSSETLLGTDVVEASTSPLRLVTVLKLILLETLPAPESEVLSC